MRRLLAGIALTQVLAACAGMPVVVPLQLSSRREFPPSDRSKVWGRAVTAFQITGRIVSMTDPHGGILQSAIQRSEVECTLRERYFADPGVFLCDATEFAQFTVDHEGVAILRITRRIEGRIRRNNDVLVSEENVKSHQSVLDSMMEYIVGTSKKPPEPPNPPLSAEIVKI